MRRERLRRIRPAPATQKARPPRRRLEVDARRQELLELGLRFFSERPYDAASIDDLARAAGMSKGLLYHYFPTKRGFYVAILEEAAADLIRLAGLDESLPPLERLTRTLDAYLGYVESRSQAYCTLFRGSLSADPEVAGIIERTRAVFLQKLLEGIGPPAPPLLRVALRGWFGFLEAVSLEWAESKQMSAPELRELLIQVLLRSLESVKALEPR